MHHTHLILLQEPWYDKTGTARHDDSREGVDVLGGVVAPSWEPHYPPCKPDQRPKVIAYSRKTLHAESNQPLPFTIVPRPDICAHPYIQVLDIVHVGEEWRIINVYHDVRDMSGLEAQRGIR
jgi:hypothetical protein